MKSKWKLWLVPVVILALLGLAKASRLINQPAAQNGAESLQTVLVQETALIQKENALLLTGTLEAYETAVISPRVSGRTQHIWVENGDLVSSGQALAEIESQDYRNQLLAAEADLKKAEARLATSRADYERFSELYRNGAVSDKEYQDIELAWKAAEADLEVASAAVASARDALENTVISAPLSGVIANREVSLGQMLSPQTVLMKIEDISSVYAAVNIQQQELARVKAGLNAEVTVDAYESRKFPGTLTVINPAVIPEARVFQAKIEINNAQNLLRPGMFAEVKLYAGAAQEVLAVPRQALVNHKGLYYVFVPEGEQVKRQNVQIGAIIGQMAEITSGLREGQLIVVSNADKLKDQDRVRAEREQEGEGDVPD